MKISKNIIASIAAIVVGVATFITLIITKSLDFLWYVALLAAILVVGGIAFIIYEKVVKVKAVSANNHKKVVVKEETPHVIETKTEEVNDSVAEVIPVKVEENKGVIKKAEPKVTDTVKKSTAAKKSSSTSKSQETKKSTTAKKSVSASAKSQTTTKKASK